MHGPAQFEWLERLEVEHDNLRAAIGWSLENNQIRAGLQLAGSLASFWHNNGHVTEGSGWLDKLLKADNGVREEERAKALLVSSILSRDMGDYARARVFAQSSFELYREIGGNRGVGLALVYLGAALEFEGKREEAIESLQEGLRLLQSTGERWEIALAHAWLGDAWFRLGDTQRAVTNWEESLGHAQELGDDFLMAWSLGGFADVARESGDYKRAVGLLKEALSLYQKLRNKSEPPFTLEALGLAAVALGESQRAARLWGAASVWRETMNEPLPLSYQKDFATSIAQARAQLGEKAYMSAWSEGRAMTMEQAVEYALEDLDG
jgi:non-specific serine/threonine protein kinase